MNLIKSFFAGRKQEATPKLMTADEVEKNTAGEVSQSNTAPPSPSSSPPPPPVTVTTTPSSPSPNFPAVRRVLNIPTIAENVSPKVSDEVSIKAQPSPTGDQCLFAVNRTLMKGHSWYFSDFESATESSLAEALFCLDGVETVLVCESTVTVTRKDKTLVDWVPLAKQVGAGIRDALGTGKNLIAAAIVSKLPAEEEIREAIQKVIDTEVNPGVAGHGGNISLLAVKGNSVTIQMGGGCQGCSAADLTLKQGIHTSFRKAVPMVGAIFDETDHAAGLNPYFS